MTTPLRCLIIEDSEDDAQLLVAELRGGGFDVTWERVFTPDSTRAALARAPWDIVLSDYRMPQFSGLDALALVRACDVPPPSSSSPGRSARRSPCPPCGRGPATT